MNYIFAPESVLERQQIFNEVGIAVGDKKRLEMFQDIDKFSARLRRFNNPEIIIVLAVGKKNIQMFLSLRELFRDASIIMVLTDEEPETVSSAIRLRPRFLGIMDTDLDKIVPIVKKLMRTKANI